eukprot:1982668-Prymnesium_polylepis.1
MADGRNPGKVTGLTPLGRPDLRGCTYICAAQPHGPSRCMPRMPCLVWLPRVLCVLCAQLSDAMSRSAVLADKLMALEEERDKLKTQVTMLQYGSVDAERKMVEQTERGARHRTAHSSKPLGNSAARIIKAVRRHSMSAQWWPLARCRLHGCYKSHARARMVPTLRPVALQIG